VVYETSGGVSWPRISPGGDAAAFIDHPFTRDDRGAIALVDREGRRTVLLPPGASEERPLSWHDYSLAVDISPDGRRILISESGEAGGSGYGVYLRGTDGSPAVRLGEGHVFGLAPDGRWALTAPLFGARRLVLLPTGAGQPKTVELPGLAHFLWAGFFPDGQRVVVLGSEADRPLRLFALDVAGGPLRPIAPEGVVMSSNTISPDGRSFLGFRLGQPQQRFRLHFVGGGEDVAVPGAEPGDTPIDWADDGRSVFVVPSSGGDPSLKLIRLDTRTGARTPWREIRAPDPVGVVRLEGPRVTPDGRSYYYNTRRLLSTLFVVEGLR
jgi:Tol biopolymer transport system component